MLKQLLSQISNCNMEDDDLGQNGQEMNELGFPVVYSRMQDQGEDLIITNFNNEVEIFFGYEKNELINQSVNIFVPDFLKNTHIAMLQRYFTTLDENERKKVVTFVLVQNKDLYLHPLIT